MSEYIEFQEDKKYPSKNADKSNSHEYFQDAGYCIQEDEVVVDVDGVEREIIEKMIAFFNIKTQVVFTDRGAHFYFKKPKEFKSNKKICPLGFEVEYKIASRNKYVTIKRNGVLREILNENVREDLPDILYTNRRLEPLIGLENGDGRNDKMFAHRMKISHLPQWKSILRFINNFVLSEPLDEKEFETISREGVNLEAGANNEPEIAEYLIKKYQFVMFAGRLYWFDGKEYVTGEYLDIERLISAEFTRKSKYIKEVLKQIEYKVQKVPSNKTFDIKLQNGFLRDGEFIEFDYTDFTPYSIPISYDSDCEPVQIVDDYLNHLTNGDFEYRQRLLESISHIFVVDKGFKRMLAKFFIFIGPGGNGKSTLFSVIKEIVGEKNVSSLSIQQLGDERYLVNLQAKLVNLGDDIEDEYLKQQVCKNLKNIATCDRISLRRMREQSFDCEVTATLMFTSNHQVKAREKGDSFKRRVDWQPIFGKPKVRDKQFIKKLTSPEALEYWMFLIVEAYKRLYQNQDFTESKMVSDFNEEYHRLNNNILEFLEDKIVDDFLGRQKRECYREYKEWCEFNDEFDMGSHKFHETLCQYFGIQIKRFNTSAGSGEKRSKEDKYALS
jgi:putative DNA primase/helicase